MACQRGWPSPNFADPEISKRGGAEKSDVGNEPGEARRFQPACADSDCFAPETEARPPVVAKLRWQWSAQVILQISHCLMLSV